eukprot:c13849_g2_i1 orf=12-212(-)
MTQNSVMVLDMGSGLSWQLFFMRFPSIHFQGKGRGINELSACMCPHQCRGKTICIVKNMMSVAMLQ